MKRLIPIVAVLLTATALFGAGRREDGDFAYDAIRSLEIEAGTMAVDVRTVRGGSVSMTVENYPDDLTVYHSVSGAHVRVWVERRFSHFARAQRGRIVLLVPFETRLTITTSTGAVAVAGVRGDDLRVETSTGRVALDSVSGPVYARTTTGSIDIRDSNGELELRSSTGSITLSRVEGRISATSSTGTQRYIGVVGTIVARSTTGRMELNDTVGLVEIRTSTGNQIGRGVTLTGDSSFEASTGSIDVELTNDIDDLGFDLTSTTGSLQVGGERSQRRLFLGSTGITVVGSTSTGSQRFF